MADAPPPPPAATYLEVQPLQAATTPTSTHLQQLTASSVASAIDLELDEIVRLARADDSQASTAQSIPNTNNSRRSPSSDTNGFATAPGTSEEDNMDSDSDDDDDSRSNYSSSNLQSNLAGSFNGAGSNAPGCNQQQRQHKNKKHFQKGEQKRSHHNVLERKRRDLLKDSFSKLRDSVPTFQKERVSRAEILKQAASFLQITVQKNANIRAEVDELIRKNRDLEQSLKQSANCNSVSLASSQVGASVVVVGQEQATKKEPATFHPNIIKEEHSST